MGAPPAFGTPAAPAQPGAFPGVPQGPGFIPAPAGFNSQALMTAQMQGERHPVLSDGSVKVEILKSLVSQRKGAFVCVVRVEQSNNQADQPGQTRAIVRTGEYAATDIVTLMCCASGFTDLATFDQWLASQGTNRVGFYQACAKEETSPLRGRKLIIHTQHRVSKNGKPFTDHRFQPYVG
jgi:hypothetical protein